MNCFLLVIVLQIWAFFANYIYVPITDRLIGVQQFPKRCDSKVLLGGLVISKVRVHPGVFRVSTSRIFLHF